MPQLAERNTRYIYAKLAGVRMQQKLGHVKLSSILPSPWSTVRLVSANGSTVSFNGHSDHLEYHTFYSLSIRIEKKWASWSRLGEDTKKEKKSFMSLSVLAPLLQPGLSGFGGCALVVVACSHNTISFNEFCRKHWKYFRWNYEWVQWDE